MYQMSTLETGELVKSVITATRVVDCLQFELFHDLNSNSHVQSVRSG